MKKFRWKQHRQDALKEMKGVGWKGITGSIIFGLGAALKAASYFLPEFAEGLNAIGDMLIALGGTLGGIGIRMSISNNGKGV